MQLEGKVALITGGASGIGLGVATRFVAEGARVMLADVNAEAATQRAAELGEASAWVQADLSGEAGAETMVAETVKRFGRLDIAVNAAGIGTLAAVVDQTIEQWDAVLNLDLRGIFLSTKHEARQLIEQGDGGAIVNIASVNARQPGEGMSAYCSAKAGVEMFTKVAAMELARHQIRVTAIGPGLIDTPLTAPLMGIPGVREEYLENIPAGRAGTPDDIANAALFLVSDEATWVNGTTLFVDGAELTMRYPLILQRVAELQRNAGQS
ncbi:MAG: SDR family oxidoreductase [Chloroflexi bacterium]|nr:SDR family oxidoreductase [Chloroflexota bacterium]